MKYCTNCGSSQEDNALFCNNCGSKLNADIQPVVQADTMQQVQTAFQQPMMPTANVQMMQGGAAAAVRKKSLKIPLIIVSVVVLLIVGCVLLWWFLYGQYRTYDALKQANANAKLAYEAADEAVRDAYITSYELLDPLDYEGPVSDIPEDNEIGKAIKKELEDADVGGYICIRFHSYDNESTDQLNNFVHWSAKKSGAMIGQCPWACNTESEASKLKFGTYSPKYAY